MKHMCRRSTFGVALVATLCLLLSPATQAGAPEKIPPFTVELDPGPIASCVPYGYNFEIWVETTFYHSVKVFKDRNGDRIRAEWHSKTDDIFSNNVTGEFVVGHANFRETYDYATNESTFRGLFWHTTIPGVGNVLQDAGFQIVSWGPPIVVEVMKGTYQANEGDFEELCAALD